GDLLVAAGAGPAGRDRGGAGRQPGFRRLGRAAAAAAVALSVARAAADPVFPEPVPGKARWGDDDADPALVGLGAEMRAVGVIAADRLAQWPARRLGLEPAVPALIAARAGIVTELRGAPWTLVARGDLSEPWRPYVDGGVGKVADAVVTDLYARWRALPEANLVVGRARVPWSKSRQFDELDEPLGSPPFIV